MSCANLDLVRSIYAAHERGDFSGTDWAHPDIGWIVADGPQPSSRTGVVAMREGFRDFLSTWTGYLSKPSEYREIDNERVLVLAYTSARGKTSGVQIANLQANLFHIRDGQVMRIVNYWDADRALADLGLVSEDGSP
jgi:ketosteroid isomerase-like protein